MIELYVDADQMNIRLAINGKVTARNISELTWSAVEAAIAGIVDQRRLGTVRLTRNHFEIYSQADPKSFAEAVSDLERLSDVGKRVLATRGVSQTFAGAVEGVVVSQCLNNINATMEHSVDFGDGRPVRATIVEFMD